MSQYYRLPRKLKKQMKRRMMTPPDPKVLQKHLESQENFDNRVADELALLEEPGNEDYLNTLQPPSVGDTVRVGKGKTD